MMVALFARNMVLSFIVLALFFCVATQEFEVVGLPKVFTAPKTKDGIALDWCYRFGEYCGQPAADAFCRSVGPVAQYTPKPGGSPGGLDLTVTQTRALTWTIKRGIKETKTIGDAKKCTPNCDSFTSITCQEVIGPVEFTASKPTVRTSVGKYLRLDWCTRWTVGCGLPAARSWCRKAGYDYAKANVVIDVDIGVKTPTVILADQLHVCNYNFCDGFKTVTCVKDNNLQYGEPKYVAVEPRLSPLYPNPTYAPRLDYCYGFATGCGRKAADAWCQIMGYVRSETFVQAVGVGTKAMPTKVISNGQICDGSKGRCDSFKSITCTYEPVPPVIP